MYPGAHAGEFPDKPAVVVAGTGDVLTYRELEDNSIRLAHVFADAGLRRGDHVALLTDNTPRAFEVYWAALRSGLYITAVNSHLVPGEVAYIVADCGARAMVVSAGVADLAAAIVPETPGVGLRLAFGGEVAEHGSYEDALRAASTQPPADQPRGIDMLYSSGTTGRPKGIKPELPEHQVDEPGDMNVAVLRPLLGLGPDSVYLSPAPVYHAAPLRFGAAVQALGGTVVMMRRFDAETALAAIERHRVTHSQWVPTMFIRMLRLDAVARTRYDLSSHRVAVHAAAPCPVDIKQAMIDWWGPILHEYYSCSEGNGFTAIDSLEWLRKPGSVGRSVLGVPHICDDNGVELPAGSVGAIWFERDRLPFTYHGDGEKTDRARHPDHPMWTTTGDVGLLDEDGYLYLKDRADFMIISGGVNIYPQEIEDVLALHPAVYDAAVIGVPDPEMGEIVKAVIKPATGASPGSRLAAEVLSYLGERIARYKLPRIVEFVDALPRTPTGKLAKHRLRQVRPGAEDDRASAPNPVAEV